MADYAHWSDVEGAWGQPYFIKHTVTSAEDTAGSAALKTPYTILEGYGYHVVRSGVNLMATVDWTESASGGTLTVGDGSSVNVVAGDIIYFWAWGKGGR